MATSRLITGMILQVGQKVPLNYVNFTSTSRWMGDWLYAEVSSLMNSCSTWQTHIFSGVFQKHLTSLDFRRCLLNCSQIIVSCFLFQGKPFNKNDFCCEYQQTDIREKYLELTKPTFRRLFLQHSPETPRQWKLPCLKLTWPSPWKSYRNPRGNSCSKHQNFSGYVKFQGCNFGSS